MRGQRENPPVNNVRIEALEDDPLARPSGRTLGPGVPLSQFVLGPKPVNLGRAHRTTPLLPQFVGTSGNFFRAHALSEFVLVSAAGCGGLLLRAFGINF